MREEIEFGVSFLVKLFDRVLLNPCDVENSKHSKYKIDKFSEILTELLSKKYADHWHKDEPLRGQGFRCLQATVNGCDSVILEAVKLSQLHFQQLIRPLCSLTIWIDPKEVSYRVEGRGTCVRDIASQQSNVWKSFEIDYTRLMNEINQVFDVLKFEPSADDICCASVSPSLSAPNEDTRIHSVQSPVSSPNPVLPTTSPVYTKIAVLQYVNNRIPFSNRHNYIPFAQPINKLVRPEAKRKPQITTSYNSPTNPFLTQSVAKSSLNKSPPATTKQKPVKGYCGYVESYPYYYKMGKLQRAMAAQRMLTNFVRQQIENNSYINDVCFQDTGGYVGTDENLIRGTFSPTSNEVALISAASYRQRSIDHGSTTRIVVGGDNMSKCMSPVYRRL